MKVFLSWSGARSKAVAEAFVWWLPQVIQAIDPWISSDLEKGARWGPAVASQLEATRVGIICLTSENLTAPWVAFEAGALSKTIDAHVCTFLLDVTPASVEQPLGQFQHTSFSEDDVRRLLETINKAVTRSNERGLTEAALLNAFEVWWPKLEQRLAGILSSLHERSPHRDDRDLLEEVLEIVRALQRPTRASVPVEDATDETPYEWHTTGVAYAVLVEPDIKLSAFVASVRACSPSAKLRFLGKIGDGRWGGLLIYGRGLKEDSATLAEIRRIEGVKDAAFVLKGSSRSEVREIAKTLAEAAS